MRVFIACLATETNTFAPFPTGMSAFLLGSRERGAESPLFAPLTVFRQRAAADGHEVVESIGMIALPSGITVRRTYEDLRDTILRDLAAAAQVDLILLMLHGAMVADGYDDCEGDLLSRIRVECPGAVIGAVLDPHCHLTAAMVQAADLLIPAQEYPHTDFAEQGETLYRLCTEMVGTDARPAAALLDLRMVGLYPTAQPLMRDLYALRDAIAQQPGIVSASLVHGFPWGDVEHVGTRVLVYAADSAQAERGAAAIGRRLYSSRVALLPAYPSIDEALDRAAATQGQVVLGDFADNAHGGAPSDSSFFLRALLDRPSGRVAIGAFWDPVLAELCADAGVGATMRIRLGGKCGPTSGDPIDLDVDVKNVVADHEQSALGDRQSMGLSVWVTHGDIDIVICSVRTQVFSPDAFTGLGIDLAAADLIVVKSMVHFRAAFEPIADHVWTVGTPGTLQPDFRTIRYDKRPGPLFPAHDDPWAERPPECWTREAGWHPADLAGAA